MRRMKMKRMKMNEAGNTQMEDHWALVMVLLAELQRRKFVRHVRSREDEGDEVEEVAMVEECLYHNRVSLSASLARCL